MDEILHYYEKGLPEGWSIRAVKSLVTKYRAGGTPKRSVKDYWMNGRVPFALIKDITRTNLYLDFTKETITKTGLNNSSAWIVPPGAVLVSMYATIGDTAINTIPIATNQAILALLLKSGYLNEYIAYAIKYFRSLLIQQRIESTQKNVNKAIVGNFGLPCPPLTEQRRIAAVLSLVQRAIEEQERLIQLTTELKKALMHKLFTEGTRGEPQKQTEIGPIPESWKVVKLGSIVEKSEKVDMKTDGEREIIYINVSSISRNFLRIKSVTHHILKNAPGRARKVVRAGDVIFATVRPTLMRIAHIGLEYDNQICSTAYCVLRGKQGQVNNKFIYYLLQTEQFIKRIGSIQSGASYPAVTDNQVKVQFIQIPSFNEQQVMAEALHGIDSKIWNHEQKRILLSSLFRTLLHQLMTAQLRVNDLDLTELDIEIDKYQ